MMMMNNQTVDDELSTIENIAEARSVQTVENDNVSQLSTVRFDQVIWAVWWAGTALIVSSWLNIVSNTVGWIGFAAALASSVVSVVVKKYWRVPR